MHALELDKFPDATGIDHAPDAVRLAGGEADGVTALIKASANAINPAETEGLIQRFRIGDAALSGILPVEADEELARCTVVLLKPGPECGL
jgi:hypothetical protein